MKITKRQLRRIIKEEKRKLLKEGIMREEEELFNALDNYVQALDEDMGYDIPPDRLRAEVHNFVDGYFEETDYAAKEYEREGGLAQQ